MERAEDIFSRIREKGEKAINEFIITRRSEELFLDFKCSADHGNGRVLNPNDRKNLAKAVSGFGNSEGGVIVWGIDCSRDFDAADVAKAKHPITNVKRFVSWLENVVSGCTVPPHSGVKNHPVIINEDGRGFVATYIPKSNNLPHQTIQPFQYYIRAGSAFVPTPHGVLAGMFGRRPQAHLYHKLMVRHATVVSSTVQCKVGFLIRNQGPGIAKDLFFNATVFSALGRNCRLSFQPLEMPNWFWQFSYGRFASLMSEQKFRLAPEAHVQVVVMDLILFPPYTENLKIDGNYGCEGAPPCKFTIENVPDRVKASCQEFTEKDKNQKLTKEDAYKFTGDILGIEGPNEK